MGTSKRLHILLATILTLGYTLDTFGQIIAIDHDTTITYCKYDDLKRAVKKFRPSKAASNRNDKSELLEALVKQTSDTVLIDYKTYTDMFDYETEWLITRHKVSFYDKKYKKNVTDVKKIKCEMNDGKLYHILYNSYVDKETGHQLWMIVTKNFHPTKF